MATQVNAPISVEAIVSRSPAFFTTAIDDGLVMMSVEHGAYFGLNSMGSEIWKRTEQPVRVADLCAALMDDFEVDAARCQAEVLEFLAAMLAKGLVDVSNQG